MDQATAMEDRLEQLRGRIVQIEDQAGTAAAQREGEQREEVGRVARDHRRHLLAAQLAHEAPGSHERVHVLAHVPERAAALRRLSEAEHAYAVNLFLERRNARRSSGRPRSPGSRPR